MDNKTVINALGSAFQKGDINASFLSAGTLQALGADVAVQDVLQIDDKTYNDTIIFNVGDALNASIAIANFKDTYTLFQSGSKADNIGKNLAGILPLNSVFINDRIRPRFEFILPNNAGETPAPTPQDAQYIKTAGNILLRATTISISILTSLRWKKTLTKWASVQYPAYINLIAGQATPAPVPNPPNSYEEFYPLSKTFDFPMTWPPGSDVEIVVNTDVKQYITNAYPAGVPPSIAAALAIVMGFWCDIDFDGAIVKKIGGS